MKKYLLPTILLLLLIPTVASLRARFLKTNSGAPPYLIEDLEPPSDPYAWLKDWKRPEGPMRVGLQVGHWKNEELPQELDRLIGSTGASGGGKSEWEVNYTIAEKTKEILEKEGVTVDIIPATIPPRYYADAFVAIHADGSTDRGSSGFKLSPPRRDFSGQAGRLAELVTSEYQEATQLAQDPNVSRNMTGYYAFAWWRYEHAVHPMAPSLILETGFLTNANDRRIIVNSPETAAQGLARGLLKFLLVN